jgi:hypothetical protein
MNNTLHDCPHCVCAAPSYRDNANSTTTLTTIPKAKKRKFTCIIGMHSCHHFLGSEDILGQRTVLFACLDCSKIERNYNNSAMSPAPLSYEDCEREILAKQAKIEEVNRRKEELRNVVMRKGK